MGRTILVELLLFLAPFAVYALALIAARKDAREREHWPARTLATLGIVGCALMIAGLVYFAHFGGSPPGGTYLPAHIKNGKLVPGKIE